MRRKLAAKRCCVPSFWFRNGAAKLTKTGWAVIAGTVCTMMIGLTNRLFTNKL